MISREEFVDTLERLKRIRDGEDEDLARALDDAIDIMERTVTSAASDDFKAGYRACAETMESVEIKPWFNPLYADQAPWRAGFNFAINQMKDIARRAANMVTNQQKTQNRFPEDIN